MKAVKVRDIGNMTGDAALYKLETGGTLPEYVVVSATNAPPHGIPETFIFASNERGDITDWTELDGSFRGDLCHETALRNAGYEIGHGV